MSHDQRPARLRVVGNAANALGRRRADAKAGAKAVATARTDRSAPARAASFPLVATLLFLGACALGGAAIVVARNYGLIG